MLFLIGDVAKEQQPEGATAEALPVKAGHFKARGAQKLDPEVRLPGGIATVVARVLSVIVGYY